MWPILVILSAFYLWKRGDKEEEREAGELGKEKEEKEEAFLLREGSHAPNRPRGTPIRAVMDGREGSIPSANSIAQSAMLKARNSLGLR